MTPEDFRRIALAQPDAVEGAHRGTADFRVKKTIFATLGYPDAGHGMVRLKPEEQALLVEAEPAIFRPANGAWGAAGCTLVSLGTADAATLESAIGMARRRLDA